MCQKCDLFQAFLGAFSIYLGERVAGSGEKRSGEEKMSSLRCHATLCERTASLKALDSVAYVRHEVVPVSVSAAQAAMRPAVSPAVFYQDMQSW